MYSAWAGTRRSVASLRRRGLFLPGVAAATVAAFWRVLKRHGLQVAVEQFGSDIDYSVLQGLWKLRYTTAPDVVRRIHRLLSRSGAYRDDALRRRVCQGMPVPSACAPHTPRPHSRTGRRRPYSPLREVLHGPCRSRSPKSVRYTSAFPERRRAACRTSSRRATACSLRKATASRSSWTRRT